MLTSKTEYKDVCKDWNLFFLLFYRFVQEFLALPRADAIHLLAQYNGNAETVIQQIFA